MLLDSFRVSCFQNQAKARSTKQDCLLSRRCHAVLSRPNSRSPCVPISIRINPRHWLLHPSSYKNHRPLPQGYEVFLSLFLLNSPIFADKHHIFDFIIRGFNLELSQDRFRANHNCLSLLCSKHIPNLKLSLLLSL